MKRTGFSILVATAVYFGCAQVSADSQPAPSAARNAPKPVPEMQQPVRVSGKPVIPSGTKVWLRLAAEVKVKQVRVDDPVDFILYHDFYYRNLLLAKAGTPVEAVLKQLDKAKTMNRGSKIVIVFQGLKLLNGQTLPLNGATVMEGGVGVGGHIAGALVDGAGKCTGFGCILYDVVALPAAGVLALATKGENKDVKIDTSAPAYVDGDFQLDVASVPNSETSSAVTGTVRIVRGLGGAVYSRNLYCNGTPMAYLRSQRKLELELKPGYYRFAINPKKGALEVFVSAGAEKNLLTDFNRISELNETDSDVNTSSLISLRNRTAGQLLTKAKPVDKTDIYTMICEPLLEDLAP